ncbi:aminoglycoside 6-adenylyltransferase [Robertmurraya beringensis]|uniref:Aminoglycoside 6-adenylyltransferase n=1 Tax=Robertmurraya beringensis TaxID=641660 RepID=A0ABV6KV13_9BACI
MNYKIMKADSKEMDLLQNLLQFYIYDFSEFIDIDVEENGEQYLSNCNNFLWCLQNVAKGIWRDELPYSKQMFELVIRSELHQMVDWWIGSQHNFKISPGKFGKYYKKHLPKRFWEMYKKTYCDSEYDHMWESLFTACELFRILAVDVGEELGVEYPYIEDKNMMMYLEGVRNLPKDATDIY